MWDRLSYLLFFCALALVSLTVDDYGLTWDEPVQRIYGEFVYDYYASGFEDRSALHYRDLYLYGGAFDALAAALQRATSLDPVSTRHWLNALVGLLGVVGTWKAARLLGGPRTAFFAALLLIATPRWWGHSFNNPKDIPFAAGAIWSLYYLLRLLPQLTRPTWSLLLRLGLAIGLTLGVRAGGLLLLAYLAGVLGLHWVSAVQREPTLRCAGRQAARGIATFAAVCVPVWLVMLACWPWAQQAPLRAPFQALARLSTFQPFNPALTMLLAGREIAVTAAPRSYALHWLVITLPELLLALLVLGALLAASGLARRRTSLAAPTAQRHALVGFAALFPLAFVALRGSTLYDGMRQVLFVVPPLACLAASTLDQLCTRAAAWRPAARRVALAALVLYAIVHLGLVLRLHPHQVVYFNRLVGGLRGAEGRYELDYWGNSVREAVSLLVAHLEREGRTRPATPYRVFLCSAPQSGTRFFPEYLQYTSEKRWADFLIATTRFRCHEQLPGREIARVERLGSLLAVVQARSARSEGPPEKLSNLTGDRN